MLKRSRKAIALAIDIGRKIQQEYPEIADDYRIGLSKPQIVRKYGLMFQYNITDSVAERAVDNALRGYGGELSVPAYQGLIPQSDLELLCAQHQTRNGHFSINHLTLEDRSRGGKKGGRIGGRKVVEQKLGAHGMSSEEKRELGYRNLERKVGIHAMNSEQKREAGRKGLIAKLQAQGLTPWTEEEEKAAFELSILPEYRTPKHIRRDAIAAEINRRFHENKQYRTTQSVYQAIRRYARKPL